MRAAIIIVMVLLAGCDFNFERRYELTEGKDDVYLLDTKTGRVWVRTEETFHPVAILKDSSGMTRLNMLGEIDQQRRSRIKDQFSYNPNTWSWSDFFQKLRQ